MTFLGHRSDVPDLMAAADLLVVPSNWFEPQGLVVSEAMACGIPVVASDIGGLPATMRGFPDHLVPPGDPARLVAAIESRIDWRRNDPELGSRSRAWVEAHALSRTIASVDEVISAALRDRPRAAPFGFLGSRRVRATLWDSLSPPPSCTK